MKNQNKILKKTIDKLEKNSQTISFAESCTGGRVASAFTAISGVSSVFNGSCVTYSNEIKQLWLGVDDEVLERYGAVSEECVSQMLEGIIKLSKSDIAIAISGIAGPNGGSEFKPVGTVYIGLITPKTKDIFHCLFDGDREQIQQKATTFSIEKLAEFLEI